jgi:hypothetical protein
MTENFDVSMHTEEFNTKKYTKLKSVISEREAALVCNVLNFDYMNKTNVGDTQVVGQHAGHNTILDSLMLVLQPLVEQVTERQLYPTYGYHRVYRPGSVLKKHTDRGSCEVSLNLCVGYYYDTEDKDYSWDIVVGGDAVKTEIGDLIIYKGIEIEHWREPFVCGENSWQTQAFLHYVDANGPYADFKWDGREQFGTYEGKRELPPGRTSWWDGVLYKEEN